MHNQSSLMKNVLKLSYVKVIRVYNNGIKTKRDKMESLGLAKVYGQMREIFKSGNKYYYFSQGRKFPITLNKIEF